ncbi:MAG: hypothetical protein DMG81_06270, partial [Acidobacteria bacterium]
MEREYILGILRETRGKISGIDGAAAKLGLKRTTLQSKMRKLKLERLEYDIISLTKRKKYVPSQSCGSVLDSIHRRGEVGESIHFAGWQEDDPAPEICPLCQEASPIFKYQVVPAPDADTAQNLQGYCCLRCGQQLLATLEQVT